MSTCITAVLDFVYDGCSVAAAAGAAATAGISTCITEDVKYHAFAAAVTAGIRTSIMVDVCVSRLRCCCCCC